MDLNPEEALKRAFAVMCGQTGDLSQRSLLSGYEGLVTF